MLEGTVHPHAEERRLVRQVPVDIVCGGFLCGEPVVVVMLGLAYAPLLELVAVPETIISTVPNWGRIEFVLIQNIHTCQPWTFPATHAEGTESSASASLREL